MIAFLKFIFICARIIYEEHDFVLLRVFESFWRIIRMPRRHKDANIQYVNFKMRFFAEDSN